MASNFKISANCQNAACDGIVDDVDAGGAAGYIEIRTGAPPTNVADAATGTLLATLTCTYPGAFGSATGGTATAAAITADSSADATGDAGWFRVYRSTAVGCFQGTAGNAADTPDMTFDNKSIQTGGQVSISAMSVTVPVQ